MLFIEYSSPPMALHRNAWVWKMDRWIQQSLSHCLSVCAADRERKAELEAGSGGGDRERPVAVWQSATRQGGLAEPCTHLPTFSHTVSPPPYVQTSQTHTVYLHRKIILDIFWRLLCCHSNRILILKPILNLTSKYGKFEDSQHTMANNRLNLCYSTTLFLATLSDFVLSAKCVYVFIQSGPLWPWPGVASLWHGAVLCHSDWHTTRHRDSPVPGWDHQGSVPVDQTHSQRMSRLSWDDQRSHYEWVLIHNTSILWFSNSNYFQNG